MTKSLAAIALMLATNAAASPSRCHITSVDCNRRVLDGVRDCSADELSAAFDGCPQVVVDNGTVICPAGSRAFHVCRHQRNNCGNTDRHTGVPFCKRCRVYFPK